METMFFIWLGICFVCYMIRTVLNILNYKNPIAENKKILNSIFIVMGILWFSWFQMCFSDPIKMNIPDWIRYIGLLLFLVGVFLFIFSHIKLKGFENKGKLVIGGIYSKIRNLMYMGFIMWIIGFPIFTQSLDLQDITLWPKFVDVESNNRTRSRLLRTHTPPLLAANPSARPPFRGCRDFQSGGL